MFSVHIDAHGGKVVGMIMSVCQRERLYRESIELPCREKGRQDVRGDNHRPRPSDCALLTRLIFSLKNGEGALIKPLRRIRYKQGSNKLQCGRQPALVIDSRLVGDATAGIQVVCPGIAFVLGDDKTELFRYCGFFVLQFFPGILFWEGSFFTVSS